MRKNTFILLGFGICLFWFFSCEKEDATMKFPLAEEQGINEKSLGQAYKNAGDINGIRSLLVSRNNILVAEKYFTEMGADDLYHVRSVTKSVVSALIGIAIEEGFIDSIGSTLNEFVSPLGYTLSGDKMDITIKDLLTMSSGFDWEELISVSQYSDWVTSDDPIQYVISKSLAYNPGAHFAYNSATSHLLSVILTEATDMSTHDFALEYLFEPLGMNENDFGWGQFDQGYFNGGADLTLKPRDMIKLGYLYLNNGNYNGIQIVPSAWVEESTRIQLSTGNAVSFGPQYGYLWWVNHDGDYDLFFANGYGGQFIVVVPELELVVVATSKFRSLGDTAGPQWYNVLSQ